MKTKLIIFFILSIILGGCRSTTPGDEVANQANKNIFIDTGVTFGIDGLPIPIPKITLGFKLDFSRYTPQEQIDVNLSKQGKFRKQEDRPDVLIPNPPVTTSPSPSKLEK